MKRYKSNVKLKLWLLLLTIEINRGGAVARSSPHYPTFSTRHYLLSAVFQNLSMLEFLPSTGFVVFRSRWELQSDFVSVSDAVLAGSTRYVLQPKRNKGRSFSRRMSASSTKMVRNSVSIRGSKTIVALPNHPSQTVF